MSTEDDDDDDKKKKEARKRLDEAAALAGQRDDYGRAAAKAPTVEEPAPETPPPKPVLAEAPKQDDYGRTTPVETQPVTGATAGNDAPVNRGAAASPQTPDNGDALRQYFQACQDNDAKAATKVAEENSFTQGALRHGINMLVITHQNYEGAEGLLSKCGLAGAAGVDPGFMNDLLDRTTDKTRAVEFLQGMGATFNDEHMMKIQSTNPADAIKIIKAGQFDATENGSRCLLHAAGDGQKSVFNALMEAGANPLTAIQKGSSDPRAEGMYETATKWAGEFYKSHPEITPPTQGPVSLEAVAERKISTLAPPSRPR